MRIKREKRSVIKKFESFSGDEQSIVYAIISAFDVEEPTRVDRNCPDGFYAYDVKIPQDAKENLKDMFARLDSILPDGYGASCALQFAMRKVYAPGTEDKDITLRVFVMKGGIDGFLSDMGLSFERWDEDVENPYSHNFGRISEDSFAERIKARGRKMDRMRNITEWSDVNTGSYDFDYSLVDFEVSKSEDTVDVYVQLYVDGEGGFGDETNFFEVEETSDFFEVEGEIRDIIWDFLMEFKPGSRFALQALRNVGLISFNLEISLDIKPVQPSML
jgi:hypothetical protein